MNIDKNLSLNDFKYDTLSYLNNLIIDNPLKTMEGTIEDDHDDYDVDKSEENEEDGEVHNGYTSCFQESPIIKPQMVSYSFGKNTYATFNDEQLKQRKYYVSNGVSNGYSCEFNVHDVDLARYLMQKANNIFRDRTVDKKDCSMDIKIEVLDSCGIKVSEVIFHNAILSTISGDGFPENECYDIKLEFNYDWFEKKY